MCFVKGTNQIVAKLDFCCISTIRQFDTVSTIRSIGVVWPRMDGMCQSSLSNYQLCPWESINIARYIVKAEGIYDTVESVDLASKALL